MASSGYLFEGHVLFWCGIVDVKETFLISESNFNKYSDFHQ